LEMGTVYSTLGARLDVVEMMDGLMQGADRDLVKVWQKMNAKRFDNIMLKTKTVSRTRLGQKALKSLSQRPKTAALPPHRRSTTWCCKPWAARPTARKSRADKAGVAVTDRGFINVDIQMRTNVPHIFAIGDIVGPAHVGAQGACTKAHVAAEVIAGELQGNKELACRGVQRPRHPQRGLHRPRSGLGGPDRRPGQSARHQGQKGLVPLDSLRPRHCQWPRRRRHQTAV
jgi:dihydrolipoamide dehydrogenase